MGIASQHGVAGATFECCDTKSSVLCQVVGPEETWKIVSEGWLHVCDLDELCFSLLKHRLHKTDDV